IGAREVTDFDGERLSEKQMAAKYGVRVTPTFQFFPERSAGLSQRGPREREAGRAQGYLEPEKFLAMFRLVAERGYEQQKLGDFLKKADIRQWGRKNSLAAPLLCGQRRRANLPATPSPGSRRCPPCAASGESLAISAARMDSASRPGAQGAAGRPV